MYRQYENPYKLQKRLQEIIDLHEAIADLEERINFAWQDDEKY